MIVRWCGALAVATVAVCLLTGCGGGMNPVSGKVSVKGGEVLKQGIVQFYSPQATANGAIQPDGTYKLSSLGTDDGAPPGKYKVGFLNTDSGASPDKPNEPAKQVIDPKYANPMTSGIEVEVTSGKKSYDFELDPPGAAAPAPGQ